MLIDLANGGFVARWFQLQIETHTTDAVLLELEQDEQSVEVDRFVEAGLVKVSSMYAGSSFDSIERVAQIAGEMGVSIPDASVYLLAAELDAVLLTGDAGLKRGAHTRGVAVRGVLWVLDMLVWNDAIDFPGASDSLDAMLQKGARLPDDECDKRRRAWGLLQKVRPREA